MLKRRINLNIGTKSVLFGAHCFFIHPWFVALAWWKLYGFPFDPRLWVAFFVHDLGYWGKPNMDGVEGETHVELGANIMHWLFDHRYEYKNVEKSSIEQHAVLIGDGWKQYINSRIHPAVRKYKRRVRTWHDFSMYHSRYYAKKNNAQPSKLCFADKLSFALTPRWLYLPLVNATGEIDEYLKNAQKSETSRWKPVHGQKEWHRQLSKYMKEWVNEHIDGSEDTWTNPNRHAVKSL